MAATLKLDTITHPSNASTANLTLDASGNATVGNTLAMGSSFKRNRIINGNMAIDQRNAGASVSTGAPSYFAYYGYSVDRWCLLFATTSKFTAQQNAGSVTPPAGFSNYLGATSSSAYTITSGDYFCFGQRIEGFNTADLAWGTANAKSVTLSFWVYSSLTGTFGGAVTNSAQNRSYPFSYTISSANTWTYISVTIPGDTSGTWVGATNGFGIQLTFGFGVGSTYSAAAGAWTGSLCMSCTGATSVVGTNGATFYITGVQLEVGSIATPYERQIYSDQLAQCQRYLPAIITQSGNAGDVGVGVTSSTSAAAIFVPFMVAPRVAPTGITVTNVSSFTFTTVAANSVVTAIAFANGSLNGSRLNCTGTGTPYISNSTALLYGNGSATVGSILFTGCEL